MKNVYVLPARDAEGNAKRVPDPLTGQALPAAGAWKACTSYWLRRIAAGDVTEGEPPAVTAKPKIAPAPAPALPEPSASVASK